MDKQLRSLQVTDQGLVLEWKKRSSSTSIPWFWLRDHCSCSECVHPQTRQRLLNTYQLPEKPSVVRAELCDRGNAVDVTWGPDNHRSRYSTDLLDGKFDTVAHVPSAMELWDSAIARKIPHVHYDAVMGSDDGLREWLGAIECFGFCFVRNTPVTPEDSRRLAERVGYLRQTIFGGLWHFTADLSRSDTAYTSLELLPHTDGTYSHDAPGLQMLHCLRFAGTGGESVLVDGFRVAHELRRHAPDAFETLCRIAVPGQYIEPGIHLRASRPVIRLDDRGDLIQVSFNNYDRAPFRLPSGETTRFYGAVRAFYELIQRPAMQLRFPLSPGEALMFDNWRLLHGRLAFEGERYVVGCYLNREDFESRLRVLRTEAVRPSRR